MRRSPDCRIINSQLSRLQSVLNAAARLAFSARKYEAVSSLLRDVHWLRVPQRIEIKLAVLMYRCLHSTAAPYLADELHRVADIDSRQRLRSASTSTLVAPPMRHSTIGDRALPVVALRSWNSLPSSVTFQAASQITAFLAMFWPGPDMTILLDSERALFIVKCSCSLTIL